MFLAREAAGHRTATILTVVGSAHRHDLDDWSYLHDVLEQLARARTASGNPAAIPEPSSDPSSPTPGPNPTPALGQFRTEGNNPAPTPAAANERPTTRRTARVTNDPTGGLPVVGVRHVGNRFFMSADGS